MHQVITITQTPLQEKLTRYKSTKDLALAAEICADLANYHIMNDADFQKLVNLAAFGQVCEENYKAEKAKGGKSTAERMTPKQRSEKARKMALARWNKVDNSKVIKDVK